MNTACNRQTVLDDRQDSIITKGRAGKKVKCNSESLAGAVSQRACVYCGARVILNPITDAVHLVHGPIGCAAYNWDIRGSQAAGPQDSTHEDQYRGPDY